MKGTGEFTEDELLLLYDLVGNAIEHGYPITITRTRRLVHIYDKIDKLIEKE